MTTWVTPNSVSHSAISSNSRVKVPKRRSSFSALPCSRMITHAEMLLLCTSSPQHLECTTSILTSCGNVAGSRGKEGKLPYVLTPFEVSQFVVPLRSQVQTLSRVRKSQCRYALDWRRPS